ncbi:hypothetical protein AB1L13_13335 [Brevibacillus sp. 179-C 9.1 HS]|uniref:hypothetical protein n=1 Tax=unclassified Brevibacillus TaxID=2684853 RepID=UPI00399F51FD
MGTVPSWLVSIYFLFMIVTISLAIFCLVKRKLLRMSIVTLVVAIVAPLVFFFNSLLRGYVTELDFFWLELASGEIWALFVGSAFVEIVIWYILITRSYLHKSDRRTD